MATRKSELVITCNAKAVKDVFEYLNRQLADVKQKLKDLNAKGEKSGWTEQMKKDFRDLTKQATAIDSAIIHNQQSMVKYGQVMKDLSGSKLKDLKSGLREATTALGKMSEKSPGRQKLIDDIKRIKDQISGTSGLTMSFTEAQKQLKNLDNVKMDKLKQGLAAIKAQLDNPNIGNKWRRSLEQMQQQYQAAMAVRTAPTGVMPVTKMNAQQLGAERTALMSAIAATSGVKGYESKTAGMEQRLKSVNEQLKLLTENEKKADQAAKQLQATQEAAQTVRAVYRNQAVELEKLQAAYKTLQARQQQFAGTNDAKARAAAQQMALLKNRIDKVTAAMQAEIKIDKQFLKTATNQQLQNVLTQLQQKLQSLNSTQSKAAKKLKADMKAVETQIKNNTGAIRQQGNTFGTAIKDIAAYVGVFGAFNMIKSKITGVYKSNLKLSDSLADIRKVSGLTSEEINKLYTNISKIDSRNTIETLNKLAYTGAKLGIGQNYGVEGLTGFVRAAEQVQMALGEDLGEEALPALAKLTEVMNLIPRYGVEQAMQKSASAIFQLGATSTATGKNIVEFSKRLMGLANVSRVSADELLAIGSAADAMGLMPEVAATAFNKLFTSIQKGHNMIEKSLGLVKGSINENFSQGKTMQSIIDIFDAMNKKGNMNALDGIFKDLGSDGARLVAVMTTMADRVDILKKHLATSTAAFKDGTAVINEYMIQNETAQALMQRASNLWAKAFTNPEGVDMVKSLAEQWYEVSKALTQSESSMYVFHSSLEKITNTVISLVKILPFLIKMLTWMAVFGGIRMLANSFAALVVSINAARTATASLQVLMNSNWVLAGISAVVAGVSLFVDKMNAAAEAAERAQKRQEELDAKLLKSKEKIDLVVAPLESYKKALDGSNKSLEERNRLLKDLLKSDYQQYLDYLGIEIDGAIDLAEAYAKVVEVMKQKKAYEEREQYRDEVNSENKMERMRSGMKFDQATKAMGLDGYDQVWLQKNQGRSTQDIYGEIMKKRYGQGIVLVTGAGETYYYDPVQKKRLDENYRVWNSIANYQRSYRTERNTNLEVNELYKNDVGGFNMEKFQEKVLKAQIKRKGNLSNLKPDKAAEEAARKAEQERKKALAERKQALRKELQDVETESQAIIDKVEEFYRLQESVVEAAVADGKLARVDADMYLQKLKISKNEVLADVRGALTGDKKFSAEEWEKYVKENLKPIMADQGEWSNELLGEIISTSLSDLHTTLGKFNGKDTLGITSTAFFDKISKNRAGNIREANRIKASITEEVDKLLLQYNYVEQAGKSFHDRLVALGIMTETYEEYVKRLKQEADAAKNQGEEGDKDVWKSLDIPEVTVKARRPVSPEEQLRNKFLKNNVDAYLTNPDDEQQVLSWLKRLVTTGDYDAELDDWGMNLEDWAEKIPHLTDWIKDFASHKSDVQKFYFDMIQWEGEYYDALKKRDDLQNKRLDSWWEHSDEKKENDKQLRNIQLYQFQYDTMKQGETMGFIMGLTNDVNKDPEVLREKAILEAKMAIWEKAKEMRERGLISEEVYQQRLQEMQDQTMAYTKKIMDNIQQRISRLHQFEKPVIDMAGNVGKKLGEMIAGAEEQSMTWKEIWRSMAVAVAESVLDMTAQYAQNLIMEKSMNAQSKQEAVDKATVDVAAGTASGAAKTIGTLGWWGIALIPVIAALLKGLLQAAFSSNKSSNSTASTPKVKLVSGMLTYDEGNVGRYLGNDGHVYTATPEAAPKDGLVTHPIATTVQGYPALVAENGPELVVGRKTTRAIMMNEPELIRYLANYERHGGRQGYAAARGRALFDEGNASEYSEKTEYPDPAAAEREALRQRLDRSDALMAQVLYYLQNPIPPEIAMYDTGGKKGLRTKMHEADKFMARYGG